MYIYLCISYTRMYNIRHVIFMLLDFKYIDCKLVNVTFLFVSARWILLGFDA